MTQVPHSFDKHEDLAALRRAAVLTQVELAKRADLAEKTVVDLEGGKVPNPRPDTIRAIAGALGLSPGVVAAAVGLSRRNAHTGEHTPADPDPAGSVRAEPDTRRTTRVVASPEAGS